MAEIMPVVVPKPKAPRGPYESIAADIRDEIAAGRLKPGDKIPTVVQLAAQYTVAAGTAHLASPGWGRPHRPSGAAASAGAPPGSR
jgi:cell division septation protein DedD